MLWQLLSAQEQTEVNARLPRLLKDKEIAQALAVSSSYLSTLLKELKKDRLLRRDRRGFIIADPQQLWHEPDLELV